MRLQFDVLKKLVVACLLSLSAASVFAQTQSPSVQTATKPVNGQASERLSADTPQTTVLGNAVVAPQDWSIRVKGPATILQAPEGDSWVAFVDVQAEGPDEALAAPWQAYKPEAKWPVKATNDLPDRDGWSRSRYYEYLTSRNEKRGVAVLFYYSGSSWTVVIEGLKRGTRARSRSPVIRIGDEGCRCRNGVASRDRVRAGRWSISHCSRAAYGSGTGAAPKDAAPGTSRSAAPPADRARASPWMSTRKAGAPPTWLFHSFHCL